MKKWDIDKFERRVYKHIFFSQFKDMFDDTYFRCFALKPKGLELGRVVWNPQWKCCDFLPQPNRGFTQNCLDDIADFMRQAEKQLKEK